MLFSTTTIPAAARTVKAAVIAACLMSLPATRAVAQSITPLGTLPGGTVTYGGKPSWGGTAEAGWGFDPWGRAYRWTASTGMVNLGLFGGAQSFGGRVSYDGSVVVGLSNFDGSGLTWAFRWTEAEGMVSLGTLPGGNSSTAGSISGDGMVIVGEATLPSGESRGFRWTAAGGMQALDPLPGGTACYAYDTNADGSVTVGVTYFGSDTNTSATRWVVGQPPQDLGRFPGGTQSFAVGVSGDGSTVSGRSYNAVGQNRAFRWTQATGLQDLGTLPGGLWVEGEDISADGNVITGRAELGGAVHRMIWTRGAGMMDASTYLSDRGVNLAGWQLLAVIVGPDGRSFGGHGSYAGKTQPFIAIIGCRADFNHSGVLSVQDIFDFLASYFAGEFRADFNSSQTLTVQDIFDFLAAYFAGCS